MWKLVSALAALALSLGVSPAAAQPVMRVRIAQGELSGALDGETAVFKGVPYAAPPLGPLRWKAPQPPAGWRGVKAAKAFSPACPQPPVTWASGDTDRQDEDCLTLNIWTPAKSAAARLPVMVWIHGGGYTNGAGSQRTYEGAPLARDGAVIVTINYRLGVLGFLAHPELTAESSLHTSGNYGILDQIAALKWVKANIAAFGGDPGNVTIFGESAGGGSVMLLTVSPLARGLFHKAISESGAALDLPRSGAPSPPETLRGAEAAGLKLASSLGAHSLAELRAIDAQKLANAKAAGPATSPILDGQVIPLDITAAYRAGRDAGVPLLLGWNSADGALFPRPASKAAYDAAVHAGLGPLADPMLKVYPAADDAEAASAALALYGDVAFAWRAWSLAQAARAPAYVYYFDNPPPRLAGAKDPPKGANHAEELQFVWGQTDGGPPWPKADQALMGVMQRYWVNFARSGDPNGPGLPPWPSYRPGGSVEWFQEDAAKPGPTPHERELKAVDALVHGAAAPDAPAHPKSGSGPT